MGTRSHMAVPKPDQSMLPTRPVSMSDCITANARTLGSRQLDAFQSHFMGPGGTNTGFYGIGGSSDRNVSSGAGAGYYSQTGLPVSDGVHGTPRLSYETRSTNTAYVPRIHI